MSRIIEKLFRKSKSKKTKKLRCDQHEYEVIVKEFDVEFYFKEYPDVVNAEIDPIEHYLLFGVAEERNPNSWFNTSYYINFNTDVRDEKINPFYHYLCQGKKEGRSPHDTSVLDDEVEIKVKEGTDYVTEVLKESFDSNFYCKMYPDVIKSNIDPLEHYIK